ncbi:putative deoxyribonuclease tatdn3 isoform X1 [Boleophthalmus pectinirostris]|uniref:putative deoxyribonuclease tatdn3 isoform X1 n=1 Tax=Boleophthalmus pectinirostris TaxID=150288 RepID=UPI0024302FD5|nr:putative deoxyribonuclease tatdn3 isoform X1 [Boleophthalmus pectinirostris]
MENGFVDCHCHISAQEFEQDLDDVIKRTTQAGVKTLVAVTEDQREFDRVLQLKKSYGALIAPCFGVHPLQSDGGPDKRSVKPQDLEAALPYFYQHSEELVAIGEIGLDFTPWFAPSEQEKDDQMKVFVQQLEVAKELNLPVNVHSRSAAKVTISTMKEQGVTGALLHNFAGKLSVAFDGIKAGYFVSFPPAVCTNPQVHADVLFYLVVKTIKLPFYLQKVKLIKQIPLEHICLETDSPALGLNKHERNEPCNIGLVCQYIAQIKGLSTETVQFVTSQNAQRLFTKINQL